MPSAPVSPASLEEELAELTASERASFAEDQALRGRARLLAARLGLDEGDVLHTLKQLARTPTERLRRGLSHGRRRPRISY